MKSKKGRITLFLLLAILAVIIPTNLIFLQDKNISYDLQLKLHESNGIIRLASGSFNSQIDEIDDLYKLMQAVKDKYGISDAFKEFYYTKTIEAPFGYAHKLSQQYNGYAVFGHSITVATEKTVM